MLRKPRRGLELLTQEVDVSPASVSLQPEAYTALLGEKSRVRDVIKTGSAPHLPAVSVFIGEDACTPIRDRSVIVRLAIRTAKRKYLLRTLFDSSAPKALWNNLWKMGLSKSRDSTDLLGITPGDDETRFSYLYHPLFRWHHLKVLCMILLSLMNILR